MPVITIKYKKVLLILIVIFIIILTLVNIIWVGRLIYPINYREYIFKYSERYDIDPLLVAAIIKVESKYYKDAKSHKGARGLMQISPITGEWAANELEIDDYDIELLYDPEVNIMIGCWYLNKLNKQFGNKLQLVIAAYNGGSGNVTKWLKDKRYSKDGETLDHIPFKETEQYVKKVFANYKMYKLLYTN